jgi:hypothetical protein
MFAFLEFIEVVCCAAGTEVCLAVEFFLFLAFRICKRCECVCLSIVKAIEDEIYMRTVSEEVTS